MVPVPFAPIVAPFSRHWLLPNRVADYLIVRAVDLEPAGEVRPVPSILITSQLQRWLTSPFARRTLEDIYEALGGFVPLGTSSSEYERHLRQIEERLTRAFEFRELVALELERPKFNWPSRPRPPTQAEPVSHAEELTFLAIELVDEDGKPIGHQRFRVILSDGSSREGHLNANGYACLEDIPPGICEVTFPGLDSPASG